MIGSKAAFLVDRCGDGGALDDVDKLVLSAMPRAQLAYTPQVPPAASELFGSDLQAAPGASQLFQAQRSTEAKGPA